VTDFLDLKERINARVDEPIELTWVETDGDTVTKSITTVADQERTVDGSLDTVGVIGFSEKIVGYDRLSFIPAVKRGFVETHMMVWYTVLFVKQLVTTEVSIKMVGGPVFIAQEAGRQAEKGAGNLFLFMALLSINLAVLNVLPIPVLDGGHLVFLAVEKIRGSPLPMRTRIIAQQIGMIAILALVVLVTYNDILRWIGAI
jgi:regulator of sigma E protease